MICKSCKNELPDGFIFCGYCGERLVKAKAQKKKEISVPKPQQLADGSYYGRVMKDGQRVKVKGRTLKEYEANARAVIAGIIEAREKRSMPLSVAIDDFLQSHSNILSPSTLRAYDSYSRHRFQACMKWNIFEDNQWQKAINDESEKVSAKTVHNAWRLITAALNAQGVDAPKVSLPPKGKSERPWLDYKQIGVFLEAAKGQPGELQMLLALHSLRLSELIAVRPRDVDLEAGIIQVNGSRVLNSSSELVYKPLGKTSASLRAVPILIPRLKELLTDDVMSAEYVADSYEKRLYDQIKRVCKAAGLPNVGVHGLRHSFASLAYHLDWTQKSTMSVGGWSNSRVVDEIYTHNADLERDIKKMQKHYRKLAT